MMVVRPYSEIVHPKYISYNIKSYRNKIINGTNGFISNVTNEILNNLMIPLPPIEEQQRIVDKIEELFRKLDEIKPLEEELDIIKNKFTNDIKKSILFNAFSENFSQENNSTDEITIKEQLKNIELERDKYYNKNRIKYKKTKIGPIYLTDDNYKLPNNWVYTSLKECSICIFSGKSPQYSKTKNNNAIIGQQVNQEDKCHFEYLKYGTEEFVSNIPKYQYLTQNDVLLNTLGGGSVGRVGLFNFDKEYLTDGHIFVIRTNGLTVEKYIMYFLRLFRSKIEDIANGTTNQKFLNLSQVENFMIPLPSLEEQQRIVDEIEKLLPICDDIDKIINI